MSPAWFDDQTSEEADPFTGYDPTEDFIDDFPGESFDDMPQDTEAITTIDHRTQRPQAQLRPPYYVRQPSYYVRRPSEVRRQENVSVRYPARGPYRRPAAAPIVAQAIHDTNRDSKVRDEILAKTVAAQNSRIRDLQTALAYSTVREQFETSFPEVTNNSLLGLILGPALKAAGPFFALGRGSSSLLHNRGAWTLGGVAGIALAAKALHATKIVPEFSVKILGPTQLGLSDVTRYFALVVTGDGRIADQAFTFGIEPAGSGTTINSAGAVTASATAEDITIVAKIDNKDRGRFDVRIT
jgi:hypothetical protein